MLSYFLLALLGSFALAILINAQNQTGFISLDCGLPEDSNYSELITGINYISDDQYIDTGVSKKVLPEFNLNLKYQPQMYNVRSFPEGDKNCYNLNLTKGDRYLIRASFLYGNYDKKNKTPEFDLYLGPNLWGTVSLPDANTSQAFEIIHTLQSNHLYVCLVKTGKGTPFISALVLRPLKNTTYRSETGWLELISRYDVGSTAENGFRFKEDVYDRYWVPLERNDWTQKRTEIFIDSGNDNDYQPPSLAMRTAAAPANASQSLDFTLGPMDSDANLYVYMHFAEVEELESEGPRRLIVSYNDSQFQPFSLEYLKATTKLFRFALNGGQKGSLSISSSQDSTLPPILNAIEVYMEKQIPKSQTAEQDVDAILNIKSMYGLKKKWQGDPCAPYLWEGLNCSDNDPPRIISLKLSSSGLKGEIPPYIANFTELQYLDLSNNRLTGSVPEFLSQLQFLKVLNLKANMLKGSVPAKLIEMSENGLQLSVEGNPDLCASMSCKKKSIKNVVAVVISSSLLVLIIGLGIVWRLKRRKVTAGGARNYHSLGPRNLHVTYSEVVKITNNFERILGKGGFGTVFHGYLGDTQVAVKLLSHSSHQGYKQFEAEVALLLRVHHRNLTSLIGYCDEGNNLGLIYEYMAKGNLAELLSESSVDILSWEQRLQIVVDAASGLEYLHHGCKPPIIHRDVKSTNILLSENFQAKIADFGLSKPFPIEGGSHVSTVVIGTPGYLDPEYYKTERLTEKSDVFSFGVVLLEVITNRPVISKTIERTHISEWVRFMLSKGDIKSIVDPRLNEDFDVNSAWRVVEAAMACVSSSSAERPTMKNVVAELCDCLATVKARMNVGRENESENSVGMGTVALNSSIEMGPLLR